jgi:hypothetical protein
LAGKVKISTEPDALTKEKRHEFKKWFISKFQEKWWGFEFNGNHNHLASADGLFVKTQISERKTE